MLKESLVGGVVALGLGVGLPAAAQITAFHFMDVDNSAGGTALSEFSTTDITVDFDSRWTGSQMLIQLTKGSIYQNASVPGAGPPSQIQTLIDPAAAYDTFLTLNALTAEELPDQIRAFGGAVNLGGNPSITFNEDAVDAAWVYFPPLPYPSDYFDNFQDLDDFLISRVSLSDDAEGTFTVLASAGGIISVSDFAQTIAPISAPDFVAALADDASETDGLVVEGTIQAGAFVVPEPATGLLLLAGPLAALRRRRGC